MKEASLACYIENSASKRANFFCLLRGPPFVTYVAVDDCLSKFVYLIF